MSNLNLTRRGVLGLAGGTVAAGALAGCAGTGGSSSNEASAAGGQTNDGTIQFWSNHPGKSKDIELAIIAEWDKLKPEHKVKLVDGGANYEELGQKFNAALAGGQLPDVLVASDVTWFNFALNKATTPLDDIWTKAGVKPESYVDTLREDYAFNGKHYGMPYSRSTCLMYLDKAALAAAKLPTDRGPATWAEFDEWAPKLMAAKGGKPALIIPDGSSYLDWYFKGMIWTFGGNYSKEWRRSPPCSANWVSRPSTSPMTRPRR